MSILPHEAKAAVAILLLVRHYIHWSGHV